MSVHSDTPAKIDLLNRRPFAREISRSIVSGFKENHDSIVLGLNGMWGSGKSTLLGFLKEELEKEFKEKGINTITFEFNPWMFSGQEVLQREFLEGLLETLNDKFKKTEDVRKWTENALRYFQILKIIPYTKNAVETITDFVKDAELFNSIQKLKKHVDELLTKEKTKLLIFLDDIDRLSPEEITEIFQLVKLNTNFKNTFFLIAYDKEVVENALTIRYGENGKRYLEKIVQVDYKVPEILPEKIREIFFQEIKKFFTEKNINYELITLESLWHYQGLGQCFRSLRDVYRYINALYFRLPAIWREVSIYDFMLLEVLRIFEYDTYERLYFIHANNRVLNEDVADEKKNLLSELAPNIRRITNHLIKFEKTYLPAFHREKGFSNPQNFGRYYGLQLSHEDFSVLEFEGFLINTDKRSLIRQVAEGGRFVSFLNHFANIHEYETRFQISIKQLFDIVLEFLDEESYLKEYCNVAFRSFDQILRNSSEYFKITEDYVNVLTRDKSELSHSRFTFIHMTMDYFQKYIKQDQAEEKFFYDQIKILETAKNKYLEEWVNRVFNYTSNRKPYWITILFMKSYLEFKPDDYLKRMEAIILNENFIVYLAGTYLMRNAQTREPGQFRWNDLKNLLPESLEQKFKDQLKITYPNILNKEDKQDVGFVLSALFPGEYPINPNPSFIGEKLV